MQATQSQSLDELLDSTYHDLGISTNQRESIETFTSVLKAKDFSTYEHSVRIALRGVKVADELHLDPKVFFYAGMLHDIGKALIPSEVVKKTEGFDEKDMKVMEQHVLYGYNLIRGIHDFTAEVVLRHHIFGTKGYPRKLPKPLHHYSPATMALINYYSRIFSLLDFYDSASTRENDKFGVKKLPTPEEVKDLMVRFNKDQERMIGRLYEKNILGTSIPELYQQTYQLIEFPIDRRILTLEKTLLLPEKIGRNVALAAALEPISDKKGCTTRYVDAKDSKALEMFIAGAINIAPAFSHLADYVAKHKSAKGTYQHVLEAMLQSKALRDGGKINQGIIEFLAPLVIGQVLHDPSLEHKDHIFEYAEKCIRETDQRDVADLIALKKVGNTLSHVDSKYPVAEHDVASVFDYYASDLEVSPSATSRVHNTQFVQGFPDIKLALSTFEKSKKRKFASRVEEAYDTIMAKSENKDIGAGLGADFIAAMLYVSFAYANGKEIVN